MLTIPRDRRRQPIMKWHGWLPPKLTLYLAGVYRVAAHMAEPVRHKGDEVLRFSEELQDSVGIVDDAGFLSGVDVEHLGEHQVVGGGKDGLECPSMIVDMDPVPGIAAIAIHRQRAIGQRVGDEEWQLLFRVLERAVVIRASCDDHW